MGFFSSLAGPIIGAATSLFGGSKNRSATSAANASNAALQREFAQNGIRWKVEDAKAAGIHPMYALGASGASASASYQPVSSGDSWAAAGNNIQRGIAARQTQSERLNDELLQTQIDGQKLDNEIRATELASRRRLMSSSQLPPPTPSLDTVSGRDDSIIPESSTVMTEAGVPMRIPSKEYAQIMESYWPETWRYMFREFGYDLKDVLERFKTHKYNPAYQLGRWWANR